MGSLLTMTWPLALRLLLFALTLHLAQGGNCWSSIGKHGKCFDLLEQRISKEKCCSNDGFSTAWSPEDLESGSLFFYRHLGGGIACTPCRESCSGVKCGEGQKCVMRKGEAKCVCALDCRPKGRHFRTPVCGTNGRTYKNLCRLKKRTCLKKSTTLDVDYIGTCQRSCDNIRCPEGKYCIVDQNLRPHCVRCESRCSDTDVRRRGSNRMVCGVDGFTYPSDCHLRENACRQGKAIPIAYWGPCITVPTCSKIHCKEREKCLTEKHTGNPRCVSCSYRCPNSKIGWHICGSNNRTYTSWCQMMKDSCNSGYVIEAKFAGSCQPGKDISSLTNTVLNDDNILA